MAVQWRTETSTGNLTECYDLHVRSAVEEQRLALGFGRNQVFFNTDLVGQASTTYNASVSLRSPHVSIYSYDTAATRGQVIFRFQKIVLPSGFGTRCVLKSLL